MSGFGVYSGLVILSMFNIVCNKVYIGVPTWGFNGGTMTEPQIKPKQLDSRIVRASIALHTIKNDVRRDCKPFWKFDALEIELMDIAGKVEKLMTDLRRTENARKRALKMVKKLKAEVDKRNAAEKLVMDALNPCKCDGLPNKGMEGNQQVAWCDYCLKMKGNH